MKLLIGARCNKDPRITETERHEISVPAILAVDADVGIKGGKSTVIKDALVNAMEMLATCGDGNTLMFKVAASESFTTITGANFHNYVRNIAERVCNAEHGATLFIVLPGSENVEIYTIEEI